MYNFSPFCIKADREETPWEVSEMRTKVISTAPISNINDETTETRKAQKRKEYGLKEHPNSLFRLSVDLYRYSYMHMSDFHTRTCTCTCRMYI